MKPIILFLKWLRSVGALAGARPRSNQKQVADLSPDFLFCGGDIIEPGYIRSNSALISNGLWIGYHPKWVVLVSSRGLPTTVTDPNQCHVSIYLSTFVTFNRFMQQLLACVGGALTTGRIIGERLCSLCRQCHKMFAHELTLLIYILFNI